MREYHSTNRTHVNLYQFQELRRTLSAQEAAAAMGLTYKQITNWIYRHGGTSKRYTEDEVRELAAGCTAKELAYKMHLDVSTINKYCKRHAIALIKNDYKRRKDQDNDIR